MDSPGNNVDPCIFEAVTLQEAIPPMPVKLSNLRDEAPATNAEPDVAKSLLADSATGTLEPITTGPASPEPVTSGPVSTGPVTPELCRSTRETRRPDRLGFSN